jgi:hypothetical protein
MNNFSAKGEEEKIKSKKAYKTPELKEHGSIQGRTLNSGSPNTSNDNTTYS